MEWLTQKKFFNAGLASALAILVFLGALSCFRIAKLVETVSHVRHTDEVLGSLRELLSTVKDAETGQRGYIITGKEEFLEPYHAANKAIDQEIKDLRILTADDPNFQRRFGTLQSLIDKKLTWMREKVDVRKYEGFEPARKLTLTGKGKELMDNIRNLTAEIENEQQKLLKHCNNEAKTDAQNTIIVLLIGAIVSFTLLIFVFCLLNQEIDRCKRAYNELEVWIKNR